MTFSVIGRDRDTGMFGIAITTSSIAVGSRCPWVRAGVGVVATQNVTKPSIGPDVLDRMASGASATEALDTVMATEPHPAFRQVTVLGPESLAHFSGGNTLGRHALAEGAHCIAAGNLLASESLPKAVAEAFDASNGHLAERLLTALEHGLYEAGGEEGTVHSAALLVSHTSPWPLVDLRVDWDDDDPVSKLRALWTAYQPQMADYVARALDPEAAPSYGVPGDE